MKVRSIFIVLIIGAVVVALAACSRETVEITKYVDVYDTVKETFLTDKGFSDELSKHITREVFDKTNIYNAYPVNSPEYNKPFNFDFSLEEISQKKDGSLIRVEMIYSVKITDSKNKTIGGSKDLPITFMVKTMDTGWIIINKEEPA
ncbi:hypothetical protein [Desulfitobacterium sp.]|uniref:hypothetical protein n=1 Tax=Desulfitobacterium sp. TaxID=49981 RepID=UPI002B21781B|nr:hypothetical protein [Desulfitobacterium sp.]MEA4901746.1 hypothetical protein [Desulfitobacterium sp.]